MISINRGPAPPVVHSKKIKTEIEKMNYYYSLPISARDRSSYETKTPFPLELKLALEDVFQGKCAYRYCNGKWKAWTDKYIDKCWL
ncbi:hypothetical protein JDS79_22395 [Bacillus cereus]|nr:hypothetical protein [Bacillus cereus]